MTRLGWFAARTAVLGLALCGCAAISSPSPPSPSPSATAAAYVLNVADVDGPPIELRIDQHVVATVPCSGYTQLVEGAAGVPQLPWSLDVRRQGGGLLQHFEVVGGQNFELLLRGDSVALGSFGSNGPTTAPEPCARWGQTPGASAGVAPIGPGEVPLPTVVPVDLPSGAVEACPGIGIDAILHGTSTDPRIAWITDRMSGRRVDVVWPAGYRARFAPLLEVLDARDDVVLREGDRVAGGCVTGDPGVLELQPPFR